MLKTILHLLDEKENIENFKKEKHLQIFWIL